MQKAINRRLACGVVALLSIALMCSAAPVMAVSAREPTRAPSAGSDRTGNKPTSKVIAAATLGPAGGTLQARNGVAIRIPKGAMRFAGRVEVVSLGQAQYDFHIYARWTGKVAIRLPKLDGRNVIAHKVSADKWVLEKAHADGPNFAVARVGSLSTFTNLLGCFTRLRPTVGGVLSVAKCLVGMGIKKLPEWAGKKLVGLFNDYNGCEPFSPSNWTIDWIEILTYTCPTYSPPCETAGTCGTDGPAVPTTPPSPSVPPTPSDPPATPNPPFVGGYTIQDSYLGGTWPRTDPWDGTWHSRSNRPANAADYWWANGLGVGFSCAMSAAPYDVRFVSGRTETWTTWLRSTDTWGGRVTGLWVPSAVAFELNSDGIPPGMPTC